ncbi:MAG: ATP-binding protein, partial [Bacteroidota bacterium]
EYIDFVSANAKQMHVLIEEVLEFSKIKNQEIHKEDVDLNLIMKDIRRTLGATLREQNATIEHDVLPVVEAQYSHVFLLLKNLIENGIKYNKSHEPHIRIAWEEQKTNYLISVVDNGIGIDPDFHQQIFEMFKRLHNHQQYKGSGLGLAICKRIVEKFEGTIRLESQEGAGSTFVFTLPRKQNAAPIIEETEPIISSLPLS